MKKLSELLQDVHIITSQGPSDIEIPQISFSSKDIEKGGLFVALVGEVADGHNYISSAIDAGAKVIVYEKDLEELKDNVTYIKVADTHEAITIMAANFYDHPSESIKVVGVTGTNGKTTIATLLYQLFLNMGHRVGLLSSVVDKINGTAIDTGRATPTTPDAINLNKLLRQMVDAECTHCFMEVSSHSLSVGRFKDFTFAGAIFTNLTLDHLDYHKTMENYRDAKKILFDMLPEEAFALSNIDDPYGEYILRDAKAKKYFYGFQNKDGVEPDFGEHLETKLIGDFNQYNVLAVYGAAVLLDEDRGLVQKEIKNLEPVNGRFNYFKSPSGVTGIVDYAHTPDALENVLKTVNSLRDSAQALLVQNAEIKTNSPKQGLGPRIISVFGCGGDRDKSKRPIMARMGYDMGDILILTSDNPRTEDPESILKDMVTGLLEEFQEADLRGPGPFSFTSYKSKYVYVLADRHKAIQKACELAQPGDYILLAGKGHETYQIVGTEHLHFDDMEEIKKYLK
jgi:UDP-N-acetylmuramoyl-L-alanyl-D-glutamate--2,6-diaminopimelate ligase